MVLWALFEGCCGDGTSLGGLGDGCHSAVTHVLALVVWKVQTL